MNNLSQLFEIQKALKEVNYPDYKRVSKEITEFIDNKKDLNRVLDNIKKDKPWEYICGHTEFYTIPFKLNQSVLIPRVETEKLVGLAIKEYKEQKFDAVVDVGTGSGCIIISFVKSLMLPSIHKGKINNIEFYATDKSVKALRLARKNVKEHELQEIIKVRKMDLIEKLNLEDKKVLLLANLPYIPEQQYQNLDNSVKKYEPKSALTGGVSGNKYYKKLVEQIKEKKIKSLTLILETEESIIGNTKDLFKEFKPEIIKDIYEKDRFLMMRS